MYTKIFKYIRQWQFLKVYDDPTKRIEGKIQRCVQKVKRKVNKDEYSKIYSKRFSPGMFCDNAKIHKLPKNICRNCYHR